MKWIDQRILILLLLIFVQLLTNQMGVCSIFQKGFIGWGDGLPQTLGNPSRGDEVDQLEEHYYFEAIAANADTNLVEMGTNQLLYYNKTANSLYMHGQNKYCTLTVCKDDDLFLYPGIEVKNIADFSEHEIVQLDSRSWTTFALLDNGRVFSWGRNNYRKSGTGSNSGNKQTPTEMSTHASGVPTAYENAEVLSIAQGDRHFIALARDRTTGDKHIFGTGHNGEGQVGTTYGSAWVYYPTKVLEGDLAGKMNLVTSVAATHMTSAALTTEGLVYTWGRRRYQELGNNTDDASNAASGVTYRQYTPQYVWKEGDLKDVFLSKLKGSYLGFTVLSDQGILYGWGRNNYRAVPGYGSTLYPRRFATGAYGTEKVVDFSTGLNNIVLTETGSIYTWGYNYRLHSNPHSTGVTITTPVFHNISYLTADGKQPTTVYAHSFHAYLGSAIQFSDGSVYTTFPWKQSQLHDKYELPMTIRQPTGILNFSSLYNGATHLTLTDRSCFILSEEGDLYGWGHNANYDLGWGNPTSQRGSSYPKINPTLNGLGVKLVDVHAGNEHVVALATDGRTYAWGRNNYGQLGDGSRSTRSTPRLVTLTSDPISKIVVAFYSTYAITEEGKVFGTGYNRYGGLGRELTNHYIITAGQTVNMDSIFVSRLSCYYYHCVALSESGKAYGWGYNHYWNLGLNDRTHRFTAELISKESTVLHNEALQRVATGYHHSIVLSLSGKVYAWGRCHEGACGHNPHSSYVYTPRQVADLIAYNVMDIFSGGYASFVLVGDKNNKEALASGENYYRTLSVNLDNRNYYQYLPVKMNSTTTLKGINYIAVRRKYAYAHITDVYFCHGILPTNTSVCSQHGECLGVDYCNCTYGYVGEQCQFEACYNHYIKSSGACHGHGVCLGIDNCQCYEGWNTTMDCEHPFCYGIASTNTSVCSNHGTCVSNNTCACDAFYTGHNCSIAICDGYNATNPQTCSGHGDCVLANYCQCNTGWEFYDGTNGASHCNISVCDGIRGDHPSTCYEKGSCDLPNLCTCFNKTMHVGDFCNITYCHGVLSNASHTCSGNGVCSTYDNCTCFTGYLGTNCEVPVCYGINGTENSVCSSRGVCSSYNNCTCDEGYTSLNCSKYTCYGVNSTLSTVCSSHGICSSYNNCTCDAHYSGSNCSIYSCYQVNSKSPMVCSSHGQCNSYNNCTCEEGYFGLNCSIYSCHGVDSASSNVCSSNGQCVLYNQCQCNHQYHGLICNVTECWGILSNDSRTCNHLNGTCVSADTCECNSDYLGLNCEYPICYGKASNESSVCSSHGDCAKPDYCVCNSSYTGNNCQYPYCESIASNLPSVCLTRGTCVSPNNCSCHNTSEYTGHNCQYPICYGVPSFNSTVCSSKGDCLNPNECHCYPGSTGSNCEIPICYGLTAVDNNVCSTHGTCASTNNCVCNQYYHNITCNIPECYGYLANDTNRVCNNHGTCEDAQQCQCSGEWFGSNCSTILCYDIDNYNESVCSTHGSCVEHNNCQCERGYHGNDCFIHECFGVLNTEQEKLGYNLCSGHGSCDSLDNCTCNPEYGDFDCKQPICYGFLANDKEVCSGHGQCVSPEHCVCDELYYEMDCSKSYYPKAYISTSTHIGPYDDIILDGSYSHSVTTGGLTYNWTIYDGITMKKLFLNSLNLTSVQLTIPHTYLSPYSSIYATLDVAARNGLTSLKKGVRISRTHLSIPRIKLSTLNWITLTRTHPVKIVAFSFFNTTSITDQSQFTWTQIGGSPSVDLSHSKKNVLMIPQNSFPQNDLPVEYTFRVQCVSPSGSTNFEDITIEIIPSDLIGFIKGGELQYLNLHDALILNASLSYDPDASGNQEYFSYSSHPTIPGLSSFTGSFVNISTSSLSPGVYQINMTYSMDYREVNTSISVEILEKKIAGYYIESFIIMNPGNKLYLPLSTKGSYTLSMIDYLNWYCDELTLTDQHLISRVPGQRFSLAVKPYTFKIGKTYTIRGLGMTKSGDQILVATKIRVNIAPIFGTLKVTPTTGFTFMTTFEIIAPEWDDQEGNKPLSYSFSLTNTQMPNVRIVRPYSSLNSMKTTLPIAGTYRVVVKVKDSLGAVTRQNTTIHVQQSMQLQSNMKLPSSLQENVINENIHELYAYFQSIIGDSKACSTNASCMSDLHGRLDEGMTILDTYLDSADINPEQSIISLFNIYESSIVSNQTQYFELFNKALCKFNEVYDSESSLDFSSSLYENILELFSTMFDHSSDKYNVNQYSLSSMNCLIRFILDNSVIGQVPTSLLSKNYGLTIYKDDYSLIKNFTENSNYSLDEVTLSIPLSLYETVVSSEQKSETISLQLLKFKHVNNDSVLSSSALSNSYDISFLSDNSIVPIHDLSEAFNITFDITRPIDAYHQVACHYFDVSNQNWSRDGCQTIDYANTVICSCDHNTEFSILSIPTTGETHLSTFLSSYSTWIVYALVICTLLLCLTCNLLACFTCCVVRYKYLKRRKIENASKHSIVFHDNQSIVGRLLSLLPFTVLNRYYNSTTINSKSQALQQRWRFYKPDEQHQLEMLLAKIADRNEELNTYKMHQVTIEKEIQETTREYNEVKSLYDTFKSLHAAKEKQAQLLRLLSQKDNSDVSMTSQQNQKMRASAKADYKKLTTAQDRLIELKRLKYSLEHDIKQIPELDLEHDELGDKVEHAKTKKHIIILKKLQLKEKKQHLDRVTDAKATIKQLRMKLREIVQT